MALQSLVIYVPALQAVFRTQPLGIHDWLAVVVAALVPFAIIDAVKVIGARRRSH
jgi:hypothetical protein